MLAVAVMEVENTSRHNIWLKKNPNLDKVALKVLEVAVKNPDSYNQKKAAKTDEKYGLSKEIPADQDKAKIKKRAKYDQCKKSPIPPSIEKITSKNQQ